MSRRSRIHGGMCYRFSTLHFLPPLWYCRTQPNTQHPRDPTNLHHRLAQPCRYCRRRRQVRPVEKRRGQLHGPVPISQRKIPELHGQPHQAVLPLLWLRRARHLDRFPDRILRHGLRGCRQGPGPERGHGGPRCGRQDSSAAARPEPGPGHGPVRRHDPGLRLLPRPVARRHQRHRLFKEPRPDRRSRGPLRHGLRARRLGQPAHGISRLRRAGAGRIWPGSTAANQNT
jgi:hypothetical protein